jgi:hypothetical protein
VRWVWAEHVNHHSSQHYNLSTALRQSGRELFTGMFVLQAPLVLLGLHPVVIAFTFGFNLIYQFWIHTEAIGRMWKPVEADLQHAVASPRPPRDQSALSRRQLCRGADHLGPHVRHLRRRNWTRTCRATASSRTSARSIRSRWRSTSGSSMFKDAFQPGLTAGQRLGYLFMPPGWSHDGSRKGSEELKADYVRLHPDQAGMPGLPGPDARLEGRKRSARSRRIDSPQPSRYCRGHQRRCLRVSRRYDSADRIGAPVARMVGRFLGVFQRPGEIVRHMHGPASGFERRQDVRFQRIADHHRARRALAVPVEDAAIGVRRLVGDDLDMGEMILRGRTAPACVPGRTGRPW